MAYARTIKLYPQVVYRYMVGREGQTVDRKVAYERFGDRARVTMQMCGDYVDFTDRREDITERCFAGNQNRYKAAQRYLHYRLYGHLTSIYRLCIKSGCYPEEEMRRLDADMKPVIPEIYEELDVCP